MLFNSLPFLLFFPTVTLVYFLIPHNYRWAWLLAASSLFYMAFIPVYIFILIITILIDYFAGILIENSTGKTKTGYLIASIISTCLVLFVFKYFNFFNSNFSAIAKALHLNYPIGLIHIILPIGLSFHTFQSLSYVIEVYRGKHPAEKHFGIYALYVMFYPQLVAGPIERPQNLIHQFREEHSFNYQMATEGLKLMAWGLFKKVVIADRLSMLVNFVYGNPQNFNGLALIIATLFFAFQIYCDFSGYSDMAIGAARVMGFRLMDNFNQPYISKSVSEFWKRWHISLSTWFRDYVYISLGGNRVAVWRWQINLFITFVISGFWHGANWTFVIWGALNGFYLIFSIWTKDIRQWFIDRIGLAKMPKLLHCLQTVGTFSLICFAWIFFRSKDFGEAWYIITHLFSGWGKVQTYFAQIVSLSLDCYDFKKTGLILSILSLFFLEMVHSMQRHQTERSLFSEKPLWIRWSLYHVIVLGIIFFGEFGNNQFIYFQF
jgi:alginate O-acetyltransferase complex protein AlgI